MLEVRGLSVCYGKNKALSDVSMCFEKGKFTSVIGKNGSGKTTLLSAAASLVRYSGEILVDGTDLARFSHLQRARKISLLPQNIQKVPFDALTLVSFGRNPYRESTKEAKKKAYEAMKTVGITHLANRRADLLSGGERQLCAFAMLLCQQTDLVLLDEPTSYTDIQNEASVMTHARKLCTQQNRTVVCVVHNLANAVHYSDNIAVLDSGSLVFCGSKKECLDNGIIEKTFDVRRYTAKTSGGEERIFFGKADEC